MRYGAATPISISALDDNVNEAAEASEHRVLMGYNARGSAGTASFEIINGVTGDAAGTVMAVKVLPDNTETQWFGPEGIAMESGISIKHVAGTCDLVIFTALRR